MPHDNRVNSLEDDTSAQHGCNSLVCTTCGGLAGRIARAEGRTAPRGELGQRGSAIRSGHMRRHLERAIGLLSKCSTRDTLMPPTELFNEGWMLRLVLDWAQHHPDAISALRFCPGCSVVLGGTPCQPLQATPSRRHLGGRIHACRRRDWPLRRGGQRPWRYCAEAGCATVDRDRSQDGEWTPFTAAHSRFRRHARHCSNLCDGVHDRRPAGLRIRETGQ